VRSLDDRADGHDVSFRDDVLLYVLQVREGGDDRTDQPDEVLATLDCSQCAAVPLHVGRQVVPHSIGLVLVERRFDERANDPLVFLQVVLSSHLAPLCLCRFGAHASKLGWPIDSWLLTDDYFFARGFEWMTYSPDRDDLGGVGEDSRAMNRSLMLWALLVGSVIGLGEAIAETAWPSWAESVGDHWIGLVAMSLVVLGFWVVSQSFTKPTRGIRITLGLVVLSYAMMGVVQNIAELIDYNAVVNGNIGLLFLFFSIVLAVSSIVLGRARMEAGGLAALDHLDCHGCAARRHRAGRTATARDPFPERVASRLLLCRSFRPRARQLENETGGNPRERLILHPSPELSRPR